MELITPPEARLEAAKRFPENELLDLGVTGSTAIGLKLLS